MKVISIHSHKGGAGKTCLALMTARRLARAAKKVCVVDLDFLGGGIHPAVKMTMPKRYLEELLLAAPGSASAPDIDDLVGHHNVGAGAEPIALILNTGQQSAVSPNGNQDQMSELHRGVVRLLGLEEQTGVVQKRAISLLDRLQQLGYEYVILDCHPTLEEISETVFRVQMARQSEETLVVLLSTADRAHVYGLLKEMNRRSKSLDNQTLRLERTVLVINKVEEDKAKRPYDSTLDSYTDLVDELKKDPVVHGDAPTLVASLCPQNYCRILRSDTLTSAAFAVRSDGEIPDWPPGLLTHSGTPLCKELFG